MREVHCNEEDPARLKERVRSLEKELEDMRWGANKTNDEIGILYKELESWNKELEKRVKERTKELKESNIQLIQSEKLSALGELVAGIAHELGEPLNVTKIIAQSILKDIEKGCFDKEGAMKDLPEITEQMNKMAQIIDHMRIFTRRSVGATKEKIDINIIIENTLKLVDQQLADYNVEVIKELTPNLPVIKGDPIRLEQVFLNLINNARYAVEKSGKRNMKIIFKTYYLDGGRQVAAEVRDNGTGIPGDILNKIFQPFFTTKQTGSGTGLGLSVSNRIIEEHKGKIEIVTNPGEGTTFRMILPAG